MTLTEMRDAFDEKREQSKWDFAHDMMEKAHHLLWEYPGYLQGTDVSEIRINHNDVLFSCGGVFG